MTKLYTQVFFIISVLATCFLILFSEESNSFKRLLQFGPLVVVGLISYSLYILHFPMIAFLKYLDISMSTNIIFVFLICLFLISYFSGCISKHLLKKNQISKKNF